jgi:hypothetical protein
MNISSSDEARAHRFFSAKCFNATWELIEKSRSAEENFLMIELAHTSLWHWKQREDGTKIALSTGYWLLARVYGLIGDTDASRRYGLRSLSLTEGKDLFHRAFAYEALARAEMMAGNRAAMRENLAQAAALAGQITDAKDAAWLSENLATISLADR